MSATRRGFFSLILSVLVSQLAFADAVFDYLNKNFHNYPPLKIEGFLGELESRTTTCVEFSATLQRRSTSDGGIRRAWIEFRRPIQIESLLLSSMTKGAKAVESRSNFSVGVMKALDFNSQSNLLTGGGAPEVRLAPGGIPVLRHMDQNQNPAYLYCKQDDADAIPVPCGWGLTSWLSMHAECGLVESLFGNYGRLYQDEDGMALFASFRSVEHFNFIFTNQQESRTYEEANQFCKNLDLPKHAPPGMKLKFRLPSRENLEDTEEDFYRSRPYELLPYLAATLWTSSDGGFLWLKPTAYQKRDDETIVDDGEVKFRFLCVADRPDFNEVHEWNE